MKNRREHYRHDFPPPERRTVQWCDRDRRRSACGEILDLSLGGMRVQFQEPIAVQPSASRCHVNFTVADDSVLNFDAEIVYPSDTATRQCGLHFLPLADIAAQDDRERRLWQFLLNEQRRRRRAGYAVAPRLNS